MSERDRDKAFKRLASLIGCKVTVTFTDRKRESGILDSFRYFNGHMFIILDNDYHGTLTVINFDNVFYFVEHPKEGIEE